MRMRQLKLSLLIGSTTLLMIGFQNCAKYQYAQVDKLADGNNAGLNTDNIPDGAILPIDQTGGNNDQLGSNDPSTDPIVSNPPADGGSTPPDMSNPPADGGSNPPTASNPPPADGGSNPPEGSNPPPADGGSNPPTASNPPPADGGSNPPEGSNPPPADGGSNPPTASNPPPADGGSNPPEGSNPPGNGNGNPPGSENNPPVVNNPPGGESNPPGNNPDPVAECDLKKLKGSSNNDNIEDATHGKIVVTAESGITSIDNFHGKIILCGVSLESISNTGGSIVLVNSTVDDIVAHNGGIKVLGDSHAEISQSKALIEVDRKEGKKDNDQVQASNGKKNGKS